MIPQIVTLLKIILLALLQMSQLVHFGVKRGEPASSSHCDPQLAPSLQLLYVRQVGGTNSKVRVQWTST